MVDEAVDQSRNDEQDWSLSRKIELSNEVIKISDRKSKSWLWNLSTPATVFLTLCGLVFAYYQFNTQQVASTNQQKLNVQLQVTQQAYSAQLQATQLAANAHMQATQEAINAAQALDQQQQNTFDTYLDRLSDLLLTDHLQTSKPQSAVRAIAEARTLMTLKELDPVRRAELIHFLWKAGIATGNQPVIDLNAAPLSPAIFKHALLMNVNLSGALLMGDPFIDCNLQGANFSQATLEGVTLSNVDLTGVNMTGADVSGAILQDVTLAGTNLTSANLDGANLSGDDLTQAKLTKAKLAGANLKGARITPAEVKQVASLHDTIMPDGTIHS